QAAGMIPELSGYFQPTPPPPPGNVQVTPPPVQPGTSGSSAQQPVEKPDSFLVWSILTTVLCCLPLGIVAIVYSTKVDPLWDKGQYTEAAEAAKNAKTFCILSLVFGILGILGAFLMGALGALGSM
ncbi:MAG: CD225/dispanin family protein, partial [Parabacteroides sp.]|nr:CD225/dispanin family protein [Parabacteroides sp.]